MTTRWWVWVPTMMVACTSGDPVDPDTDPPDTDPPVDTDDTDTDTGPVDTAPEEPPGPDCSVLPAIPAPFHTLHGYSNAEDFDFDALGYQVSIYQGSLAGKNQQGDTRVISPNVGSWTAGTRVLPTGDWVISDAGSGVVTLVDGITGAKSVILSGLDYPNGLEVDIHNQVYVAEQSTGRVHQVDAYTLDAHVVATGLNNPNGVVLSPDNTILYVGSFGGGSIYAIDRVAPGVWDPPRVLFHTNKANGGFDGINVDICGNVYFTEYTVGKVWRVSPDGVHRGLVADLPSWWIPNLRWGSTYGGWEGDVLYVSDRDQGRMFGLELGIAGPKHLLAP